VTLWNPIRNGVFAALALAALACAGLFTGGGAAVAQDASDPVPTVLDSTDFAFCHENGDFTYNEAFCPLLEQVPDDRCPGLRAFCADPDAAPSRGCNADDLWSGDAGNVPTAPDEVKPELDEPDLGCGASEGACAGAGAASTLLGWAVALLVALVIAGIAVALLSYLGLRPDAPTTPVRAATREEDEEEEQSFAEAVEDVPDLPSDDLLREARTALDAGDLGKSAVLARGAVLRKLGERRVLKLHRARTDREYVRQAARVPDAADPDALDDPEARQAIRAELQAVLDVAEQHRWGRVPLDAPGVQAALESAGRLLARVGLGVLVGLSLHVGSAHAANERYGPSGDVGLERVLTAHGFSVSYRLRALQGIDEEEDTFDVLVLDTSGLRPTDEDWASVRAWVEQGHVLWVTGDATGTFPELGELSAVTDSLVLAEDLAYEGLATPVFPTPPARGFTEGQAVLVSSADPVTGPAPIAWAWVGEGVVLAVSDPVLLWNGSLVAPENEAFLGEILVRGQARRWPIEQPGRVQLATLAGQSPTDNPAGAVANLNLLPFVLQVLALWLVVVWWRGLPFAPLRDPPAEGRRGFSEHVDALARQYARSARAGGDVRAAGAYAAWVLERVRRSGLVLAARRHGYAAEEAERLADRAAALAAAFDAPEEAGEGPPDAMSIQEELWKVMRPR
jgi:hypothetical protein